MEATIKDDLLKGIPAISRFIGEAPITTFKLLNSGAIPAAKVNNRWRASKSALLEHHRKQTSGNKAA